MIAKCQVINNTAVFTSVFEATNRYFTEGGRDDFFKSTGQFVADGCENCEEYLGMKGDSDLVYDCTSSNFDGMIAFMGGEGSWVAKWQKIDGKARGIYAISVSGLLPPAIIRKLKSKNVAYKPRDRSTT